MRFGLIWLSFLILVIANRCVTTSESEQIRTRFERWQSNQINAGRFVADENCNPAFVSPNDSIPNLGFPSQIHFFYMEINKDKQLDALITFNPEQCDGGNALMWTQYQLLVLSSSTGYKIDEEFFREIGKDLKGFFHLDGTTNVGFTGTYFEFTEADPSCCPSLKKRITIQFDIKQIKFNDEASVSNI
jgi:hypothetical protein